MVKCMTCRGPFFRFSGGGIGWMVGWGAMSREFDVGENDMLGRASKKSLWVSTSSKVI